VSDEPKVDVAHLGHGELLTIPPVASLPAKADTWHPEKTQ